MAKGFKAKKYLEQKVVHGLKNGKPYKYILGDCSQKDLEKLFKSGYSSFIEECEMPKASKKKSAPKVEEAKEELKEEEESKK